MRNLITRLCLFLGLMVFMGVGSSDVFAASEKKAKVYACVFPKPSNSSSILKYIKKELAAAKAPANLKIGINFKDKYFTIFISKLQINQSNYI